MPIADANGIRIAYDEFGDAAHEPILLIAGLGTQRIRWTAPFCTGLAARGYRIIRFDNRDSGGSTHLDDRAAPDLGTLIATLMAGKRPDVPYTLSDMAADAIGLMDALRITHAHVVGRSMGGMIAQILASEFPARVCSLVSIMSSTGNPALPQAAQDVMGMMLRPAPDPRTDREAFVAHRIAFARRIAGTAFDEAAHRAIILAELDGSHDPAGAARQLAAMVTGGDRRARLATIKAPTLVVHGTDDPLILPECGKDTAASIPGAEFLPIDGMGHDIPAAHDATIIAAIERTARKAS
jgi:pimeloyl-ACP methyl ester carboxylesterase